MIPDFSEENRAIIISSNNKASKFVSINEAIKSKQAFMVMPKWNLFIIDSDTTIQTREYFQYKDHLVKNKINHYEWNSGRPGHRHLVAAFETHEDQQTAWLLIKELKLDLRHHRMTRPTLSPHRKGLPVSLVDGYTLVDVKRTLSVRTKTRWKRSSFIEQEIISPQTKTSLRKTTLNLIKHGPDAKCEDRSYVINQCAISLANAGYSVDEGAKLLANPRNKISQHILESRRTDAMRFEYAKYFMRKAYQFIKKNPVSLTSTGIARNEISIVSKKLLSIPWKGQLGTSELAALKAHLQAAYRAGSFTYGLSIREQELTSECAIMTCRKANDRLIKKGWLTRHKRDTHEDSTIWTISPESLYSTHTYLEGAGECAKPETVAPKGIFRTFLIKDERGLGKSAGRIYAQIALGRSDINEIVKATGLARATVYRALKRLKSAGIVDQDNSLTGQIPENLVRSADRKESAIRSRQARERDAWQLNKEEYEISKLRKAA